MLAVCVMLWSVPRGGDTRMTLRLRPGSANNKGAFTFPDDTSGEDVGNINLENNKLDSLGNFVNL